jgi:hypothetical protein
MIEVTWVARKAEAMIHTKGFLETYIRRMGRAIPKR